MADNPQPPAHSRQVLVVGAGPVGLTAALAVAAKGYPVTVLEKEAAGRVRPGSRAIYLHKTTLKLLEQIAPGLGLEIAAHGLVWPTKRTLYRGREVYVRNYPTPSKNGLPPFASLPQVEIERYLLAACQRAQIEFAWDTAITDVETTSASVKVTTSSGQNWTADYLIAADGARSAVRNALGLQMAGERSKNYFIVVDVTEDAANPLPLERVFHYEHPAVGYRNVLLVPFQGGWRVDLQCNEQDNAAEFSSPEGVRNWLTKVIPAAYAERITWVSTYQFLQQIAEAFTDPQRRVLLAGEAAHLFAPFGARGLNSGVVDAVSAAAAIDQALKSTELATAQAAIAEFAQTRRAAADYNRTAAGIALNHMKTGDRVVQAKRFIAARLAQLGMRCGRWLDEGPYGPKSNPESNQKY